MRSRSEFAFIVAIASALTASTAYAGKPPNGPAAAAVKAWFLSDTTLGCADDAGRDIACAPDIELFATVFYGNADGGAGTPDAVAVLINDTSPMSSSMNSAAAAFRQDAHGTYRFSHRLRGMQGTELASGVLPRWGGGQVTVTMLVPKPGDARCCPTGRKPINLQLR